MNNEEITTRALALYHRNLFPKHLINHLLNITNLGEDVGEFGLCDECEEIKKFVLDQPEDPPGDELNPHGYWEAGDY